MQKGTILKFDASERDTSVQAAIKAGFLPLTSGLGLTEGIYHFVTESDEYLGILPIETRDKTKMSLCGVFGQVVDKETKEVIKKFNENLFVIPKDAFDTALPNKTYKATVTKNANGNCYVTAFELVAKKAKKVKEDED